MTSLHDKLNLYKKKAFQSEISKITPEHFGAEKILADGVPLWRFVSRHFLGAYPWWQTVASKRTITPLAKQLGFAEEIELNELVFVDLETTSLSIGAGTYAFLFGLGTVTQDELVIEQYFMHEYSEEPAILKKILPAFQQKTLVTFNGNAFDIPLLKNRYRINRIAGFPIEKKTIDLIYPSRAIFKSLFENCALTTLELRVLGITRKDDIPSWLIPEVYFSYQRNGEFDRINKVIAHHRQDILSMAILCCFLVTVYDSLAQRCFDVLNKDALVNVARWLYRRDLILFLDLIQFLGDDVLKDRILFKNYSCAMKRLGKREEILKFWLKDSSVYSKEELAKHYEHIEKNYYMALDYCNQAMDLLKKGLFAEGEKFSNDVASNFYKERFAKRIHRLLHKIGESQPQIF